MAEQISSGTVDGMMEYLEFLIAKGYSPPTAVNPWKSAGKQVFAAVEDSEDFGSLDVRSLDLDEYLQRFDVKARGKLKRESIVAYRQRVRKAVESYREYLDDPSGWRPPQVRTPTRRTSNDKPDPPRANGNGNGAPKATNGHSGEANGSVIDYPFPLRSGQIAHVRLPARLEKVDADRLGAFIQTLVFEPQRQLPERAET